MHSTTPGALSPVLSQLAAEAATFDAAVERYWTAEGVSQLEIFIDPDLFQYLRRWYNESRSFAQRVASLRDLAG